MTDKLVAFLRARLAEDEAAALAAAEGPWELRWDDQDHQLWSPGKEWPISEWTYAIYPRGERGEVERAECDTATQRHIARHDPARVIREIAAKRAIIAAHDCHSTADGFQYCTTCGSGEPDTYPTEWPCDTLRHLAAVYADRDGYEEAIKA